MQITFKNSEDLQNFLQDPKAYVTTYFGISDIPIKTKKPATKKTDIPISDKLSHDYVKSEVNKLRHAGKFTPQEFITWMHATFEVEKISDLPNEALPEVMDWVKGR